MTRVLLTGSNGFIGRRVKALMPNEAQLCCLNRNDLEAAGDFSPEVVIHCGWPGVEHGRDNDAWQVDGLVFTERLIGACMAGCKRWVGCGSQAEVNTPDVPYATRKRQVMDLTSIVAAFHDVSWVWARLLSVYGPGEPPGTFTSYLIRELLAGHDPALTDQNIPWNFLYVDDAARALIHLALDTEEYGIFEVDRNEVLYTQWAAKCIRDKINPKATLRFGARPRRALEIDGLYPDPSGRLERTGWSPQVSFSDGIDRLIESIRTQ